MPLNRALVQRFLNLPRLGKRLLALSLDATLILVTVWLAWSLRLEHFVAFGQPQLLATAIAWAIALPLLWFYGLYATVFRYAGWNAMLAIVKAMANYALFYGALLMVIGVPGIPRSVGITQPLLLFVALGASRVLVRMWLGGLYGELVRKRQAPGVLIYGAGAAGRQLAGSLYKINTQRLVGFLDDDHQLQGRRIDGLTVHSRSDLPMLIRNQRVKDVVLAMPSASHAQRKAIIEALQPHRVHIRTLPGIDVLVSRGIRASDLQDLNIEDLLGRDPVAPDFQLMQQHLQGKVVLVTGAGGSIGGELWRQILRWQPKTLLLLELNELALYQALQQFRRLAAQQGTTTQAIALQGSVTNAHRIDEILRTWKPQIIYHAAAYKHVPLVERNPLVGLHNNAWGTLVCARAAQRHGVERFVLISTDKAVRPTNVMGASKRLAEMMLQALAQEGQEGPGRTCYTMVRFGNVLGSSGSVVPLFRKQIAAGGPITVTHQEITRYFMTIPEAAQLVMQAGAMGQGGDVFVLDMGEPVRIYDLARRMVQLSGLHVRDAQTPWGDIEIRITGLRPGEKLYEELLIDDQALRTAHPRIFRANERFIPWPKLQPRLEQMQFAMRGSDRAAVRQALLELVEGYQPPQDLLDWVTLAQQAQADAAAPQSLPPTAPFEVTRLHPAPQDPSTAGAPT